MPDTFECGALAAQAHERFPFEVEQILLADLRRVGEVAAGHDAGDLPRDQRIVIADPSTAQCQVDAQIEGGALALASHPDRHAAGRRPVPVGDPGEHSGLGVSQQPLAVHRDAVDLAQEAEPARIGGAGRDRAECDRLECPLQPRQRVGAGSRGVEGADRQLLGPAPGRDQPDADLDLTHIRLGRRLYAIGMQRQLASAAQGETGRGDDHRGRRVAQADDGALESAHHEIEVVPVALLRLKQHHHQIGAGAEVRGVVADHQSAEPVGCLRDAGVQHADRIGPDRVHLRVELDRQHAVPEVNQTGARVTPDDVSAAPGAVEYLQVGSGRREGSGPHAPGGAAVARRQSGPGPRGRRQIGPPAGIEHPVDTQQIEQFEGAVVPAESPAHRPIDVVRVVGDGRGRLGSVEQGLPERGAHEVAHVVTCRKQCAQPFSRVVDGPGRVDRRQTGR